PESRDVRTRYALRERSAAAMSPPAPRGAPGGLAPEPPSPGTGARRSGTRLRTLPARPSAVEALPSPMELGRRPQRASTLGGAGRPPGSREGSARGGGGPRPGSRQGEAAPPTSGPFLAPEPGDAAGRRPSSHTGGRQDASLSATRVSLPELLEKRASRRSKERAPSLAPPQRGEDYSSLPRVGSMPQLANDRGKQHDPRSARSLRTPDDGAVGSLPRDSTRLTSGNSRLRVSTRSEAERSPRRSTSCMKLPRLSARSEAGGSVASTREPQEEWRSGGLWSQAQTPRSPRPSRDRQAEAMKDICQLQRENGIPMESMQAAMTLFRQHATVPEGGSVFADGELTRANLASVMRQMTESMDEVMETCLVDSAFSVADKDGNGSISFYEFAIWFSSHSFDEHFNVGAEELELRNLSRQLEMPPSEIDAHPRHFDSFDIDGNGTIDRTEFYSMLLKCLKVPEHVGLPAGRVQQLWAGADSDGNGVIDFVEFVVFLSKYFPQLGSNPTRKHYSQNGLLSTLQANCSQTLQSASGRSVPADDGDDYRFGFTQF
ncbi:unnamed protein product, partial [Prorocentrum cordatum]